MKVFAKSRKFGRIEIRVVELHNGTAFTPYFEGTATVDGHHIRGRYHYQNPEGAMFAFNGKPFGVDGLAVFQLEEGWAEELRSQYQEAVKASPIKLMYVEGGYGRQRNGFWYTFDTAEGPQQCGDYFFRFSSRAYCKLADLESRVDLMSRNGSYPVERGPNGEVTGVLFTFEQLEGIAREICGPALAKDEALEKAKATGEPVLIGSSVVDSQDYEPGVESSTSTLIEYAMPDGTIKMNLSHHY